MPGFYVGAAVYLTVDWTDEMVSPPQLLTPAVVAARTPPVPMPTVTGVATGPTHEQVPLTVTGPDAAGLYRATFTPTAPGSWWVGFEAAGSFQGYVESAIAVNARRT